MKGQVSETVSSRAGIHDLKDVTNGEAHGPCPRCGGTDRFIVHAIRPFPSWLWMCRNCSPEWKWLDEFEPSLKAQLTDQQKAEFAQERARMETERERVQQTRLAQFTTAELWQELHRRMNAENRLWWKRRGVPDKWQDYLSLGYIENKIIRTGDETAHTPAYTIPYLRYGNAVTMQYRLVNPPKANDKYRFEAGLPSTFYQVEHDQPLKDQVIICEGAIKAMVTHIWGETTASVLAVPSKSAWAGIDGYVRDCGRVWIILDPDGQAEAEKLARLIGKNARIILLPDKIDDMFLSGFEPADFQQTFRQARRL